ncbi:MAG TPA: hypothetical protein VK925_06295 [Jiangellaceae bacterium]|nr:hypothetical protein [Jiangellaceae bacterium]
MFRRLAMTTVAAALALGMSACGSDDEGDVTTATEGDSDFTVEIVSPSDGDEVGLPLAIELSTNAELGPPDSGLHHAHVFVDGDMSNFEIIDAETFEIPADSPILAGVEAGERVLNVTLHTANHEPVGAQDEVTIQLAEAGESEENGDEPGY